MREAFVGFDSAWTGKTPGGIACATFEKDRPPAFVEPKLVHFEEAARIIERLRDECRYVLVAIDQPTLVPNETGMRPVERVAATLIGSLGSGVQPAFRGRRATFGPDAPIWKFLDRIGARENPPAARTATDGLHLVEVFPALALPALEPRILTRGRAACYNPKNRNFSLSDWRLAATAVRRHASDLGLPPLSRWAGEAARLAAPTKSNQDLLDAAVCLLVALCWRRTPRDRSAVIGDSRTGYVVTPVSPVSREILERAADVKDVQIDGPWPENVERPLNRTPGTGLGAESRMDRRPVRRHTSSESGGGEYPCPIPGCPKVFHGSRGGWDAHVESLRKHPDWRPDVSDAEERKRIFRDEYGDWFSRASAPRPVEARDRLGCSVTDSRRRET